MEPTGSDFGQARGHRAAGFSATQTEGVMTAIAEIAVLAAFIVLMWALVKVVTR